MRQEKVAYYHGPASKVEAARQLGYLAIRQRVTVSRISSPLSPRNGGPIGIALIRISPTQTVVPRVARRGQGHFGRSRPLITAAPTLLSISEGEDRR